MDLAKAIHEWNVAHAAVKDLYAGDCRDCGQCCSRFLPLSKFDVDRLLDYVQEHGVEQRPELSEADMLCPYLHVEDGECRIYPARPDICRGYRCDLHAKGDMAAIYALMLHHPYAERDMRELNPMRKD